MIVCMSDNYSGGGRRLIRPKEGRWVAGVCAGLAAYFRVDVTLVRLLFGVVAWAILPDEEDDQSIVETFVNKYRR
jgi:phage shock protein PspC (stress-responsive transcriptional regulator)